jgi:hypothetical protein
LGNQSDCPGSRQPDEPSHQRGDEHHCHGCRRCAG